MKNCSHPPCSPMVFHNKAAIRLFYQKKKKKKSEHIISLLDPFQRFPISLRIKYTQIIQKAKTTWLPVISLILIFLYSPLAHVSLEWKQMTTVTQFALRTLSCWTKQIALTLLTCQKEVIFWGKKFQELYKIAVLSRSMQKYLFPSNEKRCSRETYNL